MEVAEIDDLNLVDVGIILEVKSDKNSLFDRGSIGEMGLCVKKNKSIYGGLGLSGCAGDCEGCEGRGGGASRRLTYLELAG